MSEPRIVLLGTDTGVPDPDRDFTHLVWDGPGGPLLVDAGGSTYQRLLKVGIEPVDLAGILLTHSHPDHINGLPALLFSMYLAGRRDKPVLIYGLEPTLELTRRFVEALGMEQYAAPVEWKIINAGDTLPLAEDWNLRTTATRHSRPCIALRWEETSTGRAICYSADTAPCPEVEELARGAQVLIHEATTPGPFPSHTSPRQAGEVAARAGVGRLILVHYSPRWTQSETDALENVFTGGFTSFSSIGRDFEEIFFTSAKKP